MFPAAVLPRMGENDGELGALSHLNGQKRSLPIEDLIGFYSSVGEGTGRFARMLSLLAVYDTVHGIVDHRTDDNGFVGSDFYHEERIELNHVFSQICDEYDINSIFEFFKISLLEYESLTFSERSSLCKSSIKASDRRVTAMRLEGERMEKEKALLDAKAKEGLSE